MRKRLNILISANFISAEDNISFHDTIFKPIPEDSTVKKVRTYSKDFVKNSTRKILLKPGIKKN
jgi:hypothetical protein